VRARVRKGTSVSIFVKNLSFTCKIYTFPKIQNYAPSSGRQKTTSRTNDVNEDETDLDDDDEEMEVDDGMPKMHKIVDVSVCV
jgi:hypothetical protein